MLLTDFPDVYGATVAMTFWREYIVITRPHDIRLYSVPSVSSPLSFLRMLPFSPTRNGHDGLSHSRSQGGVWDARECR